MIPSVAPSALIYKYDILSGVYTPACDIPLLRSLFLPDTNNKKYNNRLCFKMLTLEFYFFIINSPPVGDVLLRYFTFRRFPPYGRSHSG